MDWQKLNCYQYQSSAEKIATARRRRGAVSVKVIYICTFISHRFGLFMALKQIEKIVNSYHEKKTINVKKSFVTLKK